MDEYSPLSLSERQILYAEIDSSAVVTDLYRTRLLGEMADAFASGDHSAEWSQMIDVVEEAENRTARNQRAIDLDNERIFPKDTLGQEESYNLRRQRITSAIGAIAVLGAIMFKSPDGLALREKSFTPDKIMPTLIPSNSLYEKDLSLIKPLKTPQKNSFIKHNKNFDL